MRAAFPKVLANPWLSGVAWLCSIVVVPLASYLFWAARPTRSLSYSEVPTRAVIADKERPESLEVRHRGELIPGDVGAVQLHVWNSGNSSIRPENVLKPFRITLGDGAGLVAATVVRETRAEIAVLAVPDGETGRSVDVSWAILEPDDGALIQVIFAGPKNTPVRLDGTVEGQKEGARRVERPKRPQSAWLLAAMLCLFTFPVYQLTWLVRTTLERGGHPVAKVISLAIIAAGAVFIAYCVVDVGGRFLASLDRGPPPALVVEPRP